MQLRLHRFALPLEYDFTIARGTTKVQSTLIVELIDGKHHGFGESTENSFYGQSIESMSAAIESCRPIVEHSLFESPEQWWSQLNEHLAIRSSSPHSIAAYAFALNALDQAAHDLFGKIHQQPTYRRFGGTLQHLPVSSYTIGIDSIATMVAKLKRHAGWPIYKIKLGTPHDLDIVRELRQHTDAIFRVDANCGWDVETTLANARAFCELELQVEFIEQPLPPTASIEDQRRLFRDSPLPIIADESCQTEADVARCLGAFHGINVKLCKCGGLTPALRMLQHARKEGLKTMVGCMVESSVGISAAAQLLPWLDYADLDGAVLLAKDPAKGVSVDRTGIRLGEGFGNGVHSISRTG